VNGKIAFRRQNRILRDIVSKPFVVKISNSTVTIQGCADTPVSLEQPAPNALSNTKDLTPQSEGNEKSTTTSHSDYSRLDVWHDHWIAVDAQGMVWGLFSSYEMYETAKNKAEIRADAKNPKKYTEQMARLEGMTAAAFIMDYQVNANE